jgi:hypothetical protein
MAEEKKDGKKKQTKAGMLGKTGSQAASEKNKTPSGKDSENLPEISKEKAEDRNDDKPVH